MAVVWQDNENNEARKPTLQEVSQAVLKSKNNRAPGKDSIMAELIKTGVCQSVDVRNSVEGLERLRGCAVVEGFVQIVLIDGADEESWEGVSFPELREVTDYLLLYRVDGLRSLAALFPNLAVIRGNNLFLNYALVAFEMMHLHELGLHSLTDILRGGVRLEKNPLLCYADSIDWNRIAPAGKDAHYIGANRPKNECPMLCPRAPQCPRSAAGEPLCWNSNHCQKSEYQQRQQAASVTRRG
ncbi:insulin-like peptide receptor [Schistocerca nitens]|uniref:insulin-like peptide receptor n=1 Tax=Schistocerca nitens TaxID=7011 RepID=UPI0021196978|nr:insulin-like peptide receptor [Schistocerca nitens]